MSFWWDGVEVPDIATRDLSRNSEALFLFGKHFYVDIQHQGI